MHTHNRRRTVLWLSALVSACVGFVSFAVYADQASAHTRSTDACSYARTFREIPCSEVNRAVSEAAAEFRIDEGRFRRVIACESGFNPFVGRKYRGLTQQGPGFVASVYPRFNASVDPDVPGNVLHPFDNARTAAFVIAREGYRQWECKG